ncbi:MAG TPA: DUF1549 and DUF1553 domain-containing protein [Verrucomicrobiae bacterium]|jgi:hypothetical protein
MKTTQAQSGVCRTFADGSLICLILLAAGLAQRAECRAAQLATQSHWSLQPLVKPALPPLQTKSWPRTSIDHFILAHLEQQGLKPSRAADKRTLLRRVCFDLIGLPPTPQEMDAFLADPSPDAYDKVVDRLLASPRYGERWARHWLDAVHFAETHGHDQDRIRTNAWPYRDYVIQSFNADKPYSRFVAEQIAGDVLFPDDPQAVVAMGFLATGPWDESSLRDIREDTIDRQIARYLDRDDIVTTVMNTFVGTTVQCARCHDHKFDPISQEEYYGLQAVFAATDKANRAYDADPKIHAQRRALLLRQRAIERRDKSLLDSFRNPAFQAELAAWETTLNPWPDDIAVILATPGSRRSDEQRTTLALHYLQGEVKRKLAALPQPQLVYAGASDFAPDGSFKPALTPRPVHVLKRGDINKPGDAAVPRAPALLPGLPPNFNLADPRDEGAARAALVQWIIHPQNALTWRSIVNRVWHHHFGRGIVDSPNDLGRMGARPTHPELLDWLAVTFRDHGGSLKELHRLIVTSATYRQASGVESLNGLTVKADRAAPSRFNPSTLQPFNEDSDNRLLWRMNRTRLDAESIRDAVLQITGRLDLTMGGPSVQQFLLFPGIHVTPGVDYGKFDVDSPASCRRSIYRFIFRTLPDPFMDTLDCADASQLTPARNVSVTVLQALAMLNNHFIVRQSEHCAERVSEMGGTLEEQIAAAYRLALNRKPTKKESEDLAAYARKHGLANLCRLILNSNEFMFVN